MKIEGQVVAAGGSYAMGQSQVLSVDVATPWYSHGRDYRIAAGDFNVLGLNPSGTTAATFDARVSQHDLRNMARLDASAYTAEMFHQIALGWWAEKFAFNDFIASINKIVQYQLPSHTLAGSPLTVRYLFGIARSAYYGSRVMDAKEDFMVAVHAGGDAEQKRRFTLAAGYLGSYLEAGIFDQAFLMDPGHSMSTVTALKAANERGVAVYTIDAGNAASLDQIATDPGDVQAMRDAVAAGLRVTTAQRDIAVDNFAGLGYILEDPKTGAAAYLLSGGRNGNNSPAGQTVYPLPQFPATPVFGIMVSSLLRSAGASLIAEGGVVIGIALPELAGAGAVGAAGVAAGAAAAAAVILMAVVVVLILLTAIIQAVDTKYPRINRRLRHYTNDGGVIAIVVSKLILETIEGTFGNGAYFADAEDEARRGFGCPPDGKDVATRFQIPNPDKIDPSLVSGYIEVLITRDNYFVFGGGVNKNGETEITIKAPLVPTLVLDKSGVFKGGLHFGIQAFGITQYDVCF